ncbi:flagellar biosynthesis regulator FlaF [Tepidamorphus sp. 3E244]|uniref:flagellar biosynthesis regulator FlaF n=1 Tax=Tepidamorphus sp. 3E244 TaxID=3385498 RepID=UPI0038FC17C1
MHQAAQAYSQTAKITVSPRKLEADLLMKSATRLQAVKDGWPETRTDLRGALTYNRRLWTIFSTSATAAENPLPHAIKQNIGNLGVFILRHTLDLEGDPAPEKLASLILINRELAAGLRGQ